MSRVLSAVLRATSIVLFTSPLHGATAPDIWSRIESDRVCPIASVWRLGTDLGRAPTEMIETVVPMEVDGRKVWRVMHTMLRGVEDARHGKTPGFDLVDLDRATLAPVQSEHRTQGSLQRAARINRFDFQAIADTALRLNGDGSIMERIALPQAQHVLAEPGAAVYDQAIPWSDGLTLRGHLLDRWRGRGNRRLREIEITVIGRGSVTIAGEELATFVVEEASIDGSFRVIKQVTADRPHRQVHTKYFPAGARTSGQPFTSEVSALMQGDSCTTMRQASIGR